jgi:hypothetical protein
MHTLDIFVYVCMYVCMNICMQILQFYFVYIHTYITEYIVFIYLYERLPFPCSDQRGGQDAVHPEGEDAHRGGGLQRPRVVQCGEATR